MILTTLLLLSALDATHWGRSKLLSDDHQHDWVKIHADAPRAMWWDRASVDTDGNDLHDYPTVLVRLIMGDESSPISYMDIHQAVDCETNQMGFLGVYIVGTQSPEPIERVENTPDFQGSSVPQLGEVDAMMRAVCGDDWGGF